MIRGRAVGMLVPHDEHWRQAIFHRAFNATSLELVIDLGFNEYRTQEVQLLGIKLDPSQQIDNAYALDFVNRWFAARENKCVVRTHKSAAIGLYLADVIDPVSGISLVDDLVNTGYGIKTGFA
jgi:hypothetical protein